MRVFLALALAGQGFLSGCSRTSDAVSESAGPRPFDQFQAAAYNGRVALAAGAGGALVLSADAGRSWRRRALSSSASIIAAAACPDRTFVLLDFYRAVWVGDSEGAAWRRLPLPTASQPLSVTCDPAGRLWVAGSWSTILSSGDRGLHWKERRLGGDAMLNVVQFVDGDAGFIVGEFGGFFSTHDGGRSWRKGPALPGGLYPYAALFGDRSHGWVTGRAGGVLATIDGGKRWAPQTNPTGASLYTLARHDGRLYAAGERGSLLRLEAGRWTPVGAADLGFGAINALATLGPEGLLVAGDGGLAQALGVAR